LFKIDDRLRPIILLKHDTNYWKLFLIELKWFVQFTNWPMVNFLICNEIFMIRKSIILWCSMTFSLLLTLASKTSFVGQF
jgi:hypothetical protein